MYAAKQKLITTWLVVHAILMQEDGSSTSNPISYYRVFLLFFP